MRRSIARVFAALAVVALLVPAAAQEPTADQLAPGLAMRVEMRGGSADDSLAEDVRVARLLALHVPRGQTVTPFVRRGPYQITWEGWLDVPRRDNFVFGAVGAGNFTLTIDGEAVLEAKGRFTEPVSSEELRLKKGLRKVVATYLAPLSGQADLRVTWQCRKFGVEPIPPTAWFHEPAAVEGLAEGLVRRAGRMAFATHRCASCHGSPAGAGTMPELAMRGPSLVDAGDRLQTEWMARWIVDPRAMRSAARMPRVDLGEDPAQTAADLAAWLATRKSGDLGELAAGDATNGHAKFVELGCFTCHDFAAEDASEAWIPLGGVAAKFAGPGVLAEFLREPGAKDPWIRMPHLHLDDAEAADLAAFVWERAEPPQAAESAGDAARGEQAYRDLGCASCHEADATPAAATLADLAGAAAAWQRGCVADTAEARGAAPDFGLSGAERAALRGFAASLPVAALGRTSPNEFATRQLDERRCNACHEVDGATSLWTTREARLTELGLALPGSDEPVDLEGHGELLQLRPALTWVGEKLRMDWTKGFLRGDIASPRSWLHARMPKLPGAVVDPLVEGLAHQHGIAADPEPWEADSRLVAEGRKLIEQTGGFGCVTCHAVGDRMPAALFEVQGINFRDVDARLRPGFYARWMMDPERIEPAAKMPRYADPDGHTALPAFGGDAAQQFESIRHFQHGGSELK